MSKKAGTVQWKTLPEDLWDNIFLNYCDYESIIQSREVLLQSKYVKSCTVVHNSTLAIKANNLDNLKWIYHCRGLLKQPYLRDDLAEAAGCGYLEIMKWLWEAWCVINACTFVKGSRCGDVQSMSWQKEEEWLWDSWTFLEVVHYGDLKILKW